MDSYLNENCRGLCQILQRSWSCCNSDWYLKCKVGVGWKQQENPAAAAGNMNKSQHPQCGEPEWGGRKVTLSIPQHLVCWRGPGWGGARQEGNTKQHSQIGFSSCSQQGEDPEQQGPRSWVRSLPDGRSALECPGCCDPATLPSPSCRFLS